MLHYNAKFQPASPQYSEDDEKHHLLVKNAIHIRVNVRWIIGTIEHRPFTLLVMLLVFPSASKLFWTHNIYIFYHTVLE